MDITFVILSAENRTRRQKIIINPNWDYPLKELRLDGLKKSMKAREVKRRKKLVRNICETEEKGFERAGDYEGLCRITKKMLIPIRFTNTRCN